MRTNLFKSLLVAVMAVGALGGVNAQDYVTTQDNATDPNKQDVTYTFNDKNKYNSKGVLVDANKVASTYNGSSYTPLYSCTTEGLERLAFNSANGTALKGGKWWWRNDPKPKNNGLQLRSQRATGDRTNAIGFLNLKAGNTINIKTTNVSGDFFSFYGASSINSVDQTPQKEAGEANYTVTYSDNNININVTSDGYVSSFVKSFDVSGYIHSITITEAKPNVVKPEGNITKVDGTKRVISLTSETKDASIYYTTDGSEPKVTSKLYNTAEGIIIDNTTTIKAIAASGDKNSEVYSETFEAGTEVSLATPTFEITNLTEGNGVFKPTYKFSIDNSKVLCTPEATFSAQFNGEDVANFDGTFNVETKGNLVVIASANGYTSTSISINVNNYIYSKNVSFDNISESDLTERLGEGWTASETSTRWSSWSRTDGIDKSLIKTNDDKYYTASNTGAFTVDFVQFPNKTDLLFGYGFGSNDGIRTATIADAPKGSMAKYNVCGWGTTKISKYVDYNKGGELPYTIERSNYTVRSVELYLPATETVSVTEAGFATYATTNNVVVPNDENVKVMTVKVNDDNSTITLYDVPAGKVIPANTGILVKAAQGDYNFVVTSDEGKELENNSLVAAKEAVTSDGATFFALTKMDTKVGFAVVKEGVKIPAGKAYLSVPKASGAKFFGLDGEATGINSVKTAKADGAYYTIEGVKTTKPVKGLYIHNGKKIVVK